MTCTQAVLSTVVLMIMKSKHGSAYLDAVFRIGGRGAISIAVVVVVIVGVVAICLRIASGWRRWRKSRHHGALLQQSRLLEEVVERSGQSREFLRVERPIVGVGCAHRLHQT